MHAPFWGVHGAFWGMNAPFWGVHGTFCEAAGAKSAGDAASGADVIGKSVRHVARVMLRPERWRSPGSSPPIMPLPPRIALETRVENAG